MVPAASLVAVAGVPRLVDECMRGREREQLEKLTKEVFGFHAPRFISLSLFPSSRSKPRRNSCASCFINTPSLKLIHFAIQGGLEEKHGEKPESK